MPQSEMTEKWLGAFPGLKRLDERHLDMLKGAVRFPQLAQGAVAYHQGWACANYVMCLEGGTRSFKSSATGRELLIYTVGPGETCVLTTQCLLAGGTFPAESVALAPTRLAAVPAETFHYLMGVSDGFRRFVLDDFSTLLTRLITLVDEVAFASLDERLARRLIAEADAEGVVLKTHQQIALDLGSVREVVSRLLADWERAGWVRLARGRIEISDRAALASYKAAR